MTRVDDVQAVVFGLDAEVFALSVEVVREILDHRPAFRMPHAPEWLAGLIDVRGDAISVVDLNVRLGRAPTAVTPTTRILVVDAVAGERRLTLGLIVSRVLEVCAFTPDEIEAAPEIGGHWRSDYVGGVTRRGGAFVVHLDLARIFAGDADALNGDLRDAA